jgi:hypothetical protein
MKRLPFVPADSSMHDCPMAMPTPTVWICSRTCNLLGKVRKVMAKPLADCCPHPGKPPG